MNRIKEKPGNERRDSGAQNSVGTGGAADKEKADIVAKTADELGVDQNTKSAAVMSAYLGASGESITRILGTGLNRKLTDEAEVNNPKSDETPDYSEIEKIISEMLTEGTGAHFLDSGGAYGRHWQRNRQITDFRDKPDLSLDIYNSEKHGLSVSFTVDVFHYLTAFLETDEKSGEYERRLNEIIQGGESGYSAMHTLAEKLSERGEIDNCHSFNTYNHESMLSQCLQGIWLFETRDGFYGETYLILQVHNGADVRGGYTRPRVFYVPGAEYMIGAESDVNAACNCGSIYSDCCGYHWYIGNDDRDTPQVDLNGEITPVFTQDGDKLPREWVPNEAETALICKRCGAEVNFSVSLCW